MDYYEMKARKKERQFLRGAASRTFSTGSGRQNIILSFTDKEILFTTCRSKVAQKISRVNLRKAIYHLYYRRTVTRQELATKFRCHFNSAVLGLLRSMFIEIARIHKACKGGSMRLTLRSVRHFFSGAVRAPKDLLLAIKNGAKYFLISYAHVRERKNWHVRFEELSRQFGIKLLIDSGAFTLHQALKQGKAIEPLTAKAYADFLDQFKHLIYGAFSLDVIGDPEASAANTRYLRERGHSPIEVFHYGSSWDVLAEMVKQDPEIIAIGGTVGLSEKMKRSFFEELFQRQPGQLYHLLGCGSPLLMEFPFFSADSSTWLMGRKFNIILTPKQIKAPASWSKEECVAHNVRLLAGYEEWYENPLQLEIIA